MDDQFPVDTPPEELQPTWDIVSAWYDAARCPPPHYVERVQLRPTYSSLEEVSEDIAHQLVEMIDEREEIRGFMRATHRHAAPEIAEALLDKGHFVLATVPRRMQNHDLRPRTLEDDDIGIHPFPPRGTVSNQRPTTPLRSPILESSIWGPLNDSVQSLTLDRNLTAPSPPSYSDAIAQNSNADTVAQALRVIDSHINTQRHQPAPSRIPRRITANDRADRAPAPVKIQSGIMKMWTEPESRRHRKVSINVVATSMRDGKHSISIECNGQYIDGGLVGKNVSIETNLLSEATDRARLDLMTLTQRQGRRAIRAGSAGGNGLADET